MSDYTTIRITKKLKQELDRLKVSARETYNQIIEDLVEDTYELSEQTKKELEEGLKDIKNGRVYTQEEIEKEFGV